MGLMGLMGLLSRFAYSALKGLMGPYRALWALWALCFLLRFAYRALKSLMLLGGSWGVWSPLGSEEGSWLRAKILPEVPKKQILNFSWCSPAAQAC